MALKTSSKSVAQLGELSITCSSILREPSLRWVACHGLADTRYFCLLQGRHVHQLSIDFVLYSNKDTTHHAQMDL